MEVRVAHHWRLTPEEFRAKSESEQDEMTALLTEVCGSCGNLKSVCSDPERPFYPQQHRCYITAAEAIARRKVDRLYGHPEPKSGPHFTDGLTVRASEFDLTPDDEFLDTPEEAAMRALVAGRTE